MSELQLSDIFQILSYAGYVVIYIVVGQIGLALADSLVDGYFLRPDQNANYPYPRFGPVKYLLLVLLWPLVTAISLLYNILAPGYWFAYKRRPWDRR